MPRTRHVCAEPGCPTLVTTGRCAEHARPNRQARGYDREYERERRTLPPPMYCANCGKPFGPDRRPTAGHRHAIRDGGDASGGLEWQCEECNYGWRRTGL